jgi:outer membrane lipoprotein
MSGPVKEGDGPRDLSYRDLIEQADRYIDQTVVVGGYVLSVENQRDRTLVLALQAPLGVAQEPKARDLSEGRLILLYDGFLDPEVFTKNRKFTVGGKIIGSSATEKEAESFPYLRLKVEEIHLWPKEPILRPDPYWYDPWWRPYPWYWYPYPYWRHPHRHW